VCNSRFGKPPPTDAGGEGSATPHAKLPGTIYTAAEEVEKAGGNAFPMVLDIRNADAIAEVLSSSVEIEGSEHLYWFQAMEATASRFGGIDIVINNVRILILGFCGC
jgi:citronellol/citronellal dehydrogenase